MYNLPELVNVYIRHPSVFRDAVRSYLACTGTPNVLFWVKDETDVKVLDELLWDHFGVYVKARYLLIDKPALLVYFVNNTQ